MTDQNPPTGVVNPVLPPGFSEEQFEPVVEAFGRCVGPDALVRSPEGLAEYWDPYPVGAPDEFAPSLVVMPQSVEEVQAVLRVANEHRVPLWTVSTGKNLGVGGAAPRVRGSVLVHLQRMNRVLEVNEEFAYALVEPGVRFFDLHEHLKANGHRLIPSLPSLGWGSVLGNALERGHGVYGDHADLQCGMEVVLANGEVFRTGLGAVPGGRSWQLHRHGYGPSPDELFKQSNFGVVTKLGIWLVPTPECIAACTLSAPREEDLGALVETLRSLLRQGVIQNYPTCMSPLIVAAMSGLKRADVYDGDGAIPSAVIGQIAERLGVGWWTVSLPIYGPEGMVDVRLGLIEQALSQIPGAKLVAHKYAGDTPVEQIEPRHNAVFGIPDLTALAFLDWPGGSGGHLPYGPTAPCTAAEASEHYALVTRLAAEHGFDNMYILRTYPRTCLQTFEILYDTDNEQQKRAAGELYRAFMREASPLGRTVCRSHVGFMDETAADYGWNDGALMRFNETLKDALDPNGILSPGKQGIWPAAMRGTTAD